jgi:hypothetical protein
MTRAEIRDRTLQRVGGGAKLKAITATDCNIQRLQQLGSVL